MALKRDPLYSDIEVNVVLDLQVSFNLQHANLLMVGADGYGIAPGIACHRFIPMAIVVLSSGENFSHLPGLS